MASMFFSSKQLHSHVNYISEKQKHGCLVTKLQTKNLFRGRERDSDHYMGHESLFFLGITMPDSGLT